MRETAGATAWLKLNPRNAAARLRLFCFPYAGGSALIYRRWQEGLGAEIDVCPVQLPGRENRFREQPFTSMRPLVEAAAEALTPYFDRPFAFFGHSLGAVVGYELAQFLRESGAPQPVHLFVSGRRAPQVVSTKRRLFDLPKDELLEELRILNGTPKEVLEHPELMELLLPLLCADLEVIQTYKYSPRPPLDCPISAFRGLQDETEGAEATAAWREHTTSAFSIRTLPGDHFFLHTSLPLLLQAISLDLKRHVGW